MKESTAVAAISAPVSPSPAISPLPSNLACSREGSQTRGVHWAAAAVAVVVASAVACAQCDQMLELKVALFSPNHAQNVANRISFT